MATSRENLDIIIRLKDEASREVKRLQKEFEDLGGNSLLKSRKEIQKLKGDIDTLKPATDKATGGIKGALAKIPAPLKAIGTAVIGVGAAYKAWEIGKQIIQDSTALAAEYEATMISLEAVTRVTGRNMGKVYAEMESHLGGLANEANVASGFLKGMTTTLDVDQISNMTQAIKDASIAMGEDFNTQLPLIIKAVKQLNPAILDNIGVTVRLDEVNKRIRDGFYGAGTAINEYTQQNAIYQEILKQTAQFQGQEASYLETAQGKWKKLTVAFQDAEISLGSFLLKAANPVLDVLVAFTKGTEDNSAEVKRAGEYYDAMTQRLQELRGQLQSGAIDVQQFRLEVEKIGQEQTVVFTPEEIRMWAELAANASNAGDAIASMANVIPTSQMIEFQKEVYKFQKSEAFDVQKKEADRYADSVERMQVRAAEAHQRLTDAQNVELEKRVGSWQQKQQEQFEKQKLYGDQDIELFAGLLEYKQQLLEEGLDVETATRLAQLQFIQEEDERYNLLQIENEQNRAAAEIGLTRNQLIEMQQIYQQSYQKIYEYVTNYTKRIGQDFRSTIQRMVSDTDQGVGIKMKEIWKELARSVRSVLIDVMLDAIFQVIGGILKTIPALAAETVATKALTKSYISLAAAKAAVNPLSAGGRIAAAAVVKGSLTGLLGFDDPLNDSVARRHGRDYASEFMAGQREVFGSPGYGKRVVDMQPEAGIGTQGAGIAVTVNLDGATIYGNDNLAEKIEEAVINGISRLQLQNDFLTGTSPYRV